MISIAKFYFFINDSVGCATTDDYYYANEIYRTTDCGLTWTGVFQDDAGNLNGVSTIVDNTVIFNVDNFTTIEVVQALLSRNVIFSRYFVQRLLMHFGSYDEKLIELKKSTEFIKILN